MPDILQTIKCTITYMGKDCPKSTGWFFAYAKARFGKITIKGFTPFPLDKGSDIIIKAKEIGDGEYWVDAENIQLNPSNRRQTIAFLSGEDFPGIGYRIAEKLYDAFGSSVFDVIRDEPEKLKDELKLTSGQINSLRSGCMDNVGNVKSCFPQIPKAVIKTMLNTFGTEASLLIDKIKENPYKFISIINGYTFKIADDIAINTLGVPKNNWDRLGHVMAYVLESELQDTGHNFIPLYDTSWFQHLKYAFDKEAGVAGTPEQFSALLAEEGRRYTIADSSKGPLLYTRKGMRAEKNTVNAVHKAKDRCVNFIKKGTGIPDLTAKQVADRVKNFKSTPEASAMDAEQAQALCTSLLSGISIITGGPGRGKSLTAKWLCDLWEKRFPNFPPSLFAPTGRAAKNLSEKTGRRANTVARLEIVADWLREFNEQHGHYINRTDTHGTLTLTHGGLAIIDEASMIGTEAMGTLLDILVGVYSMQVVIIGDPDQLPPIDYGCPFKDMIASGKIPVSRLTVCHRADIKTIADNGEKIATGDPSLTWTNDFRLVKLPDGNSLQQAVTMCYYGLMGINPAKPSMPTAKQFSKVLLLAAMNKGTAGIRSLNMSIQNTLNPPKQAGQVTFYADDPNITNPVRFTGTQGYEIPGTLYTGDDGTKTHLRIGDRVVCTKNNPDIEVKYHVGNDMNNPEDITRTAVGINNGDCGRIIRYYEATRKVSAIIVVQLDNNAFAKFPVQTDNTFGLDLTLGYALTVHKAQGAEAETVLMSMQHELYYMPEGTDFANRNLLNTAVTRAKKSVSIMGSEDALNRCIATEVAVRFTRLPELLP